MNRKHPSDRETQIKGYIDPNNIFIQIEEIMQEEIFRFSVVRNPQRIPVKKLKTSVIHLIDEASDKYSVYTEFLDVKKKGEKRENYIEFATRKLTQKSFVKSMSDLRSLSYE